MPTLRKLALASWVRCIVIAMMGLVGMEDIIYLLLPAFITQTQDIADNFKTATLQFKMFPSSEDQQQNLFSCLKKDACAKNILVRLRF